MVDIEINTVKTFSRYFDAVVTMLGCWETTQWIQPVCLAYSVFAFVGFSPPLSGLAFYLIKSAEPSYQIFFNGILKHIHSPNAIIVSGGQADALIPWISLHKRKKGFQSAISHIFAPGLGTLTWTKNSAPLTDMTGSPWDAYQKRKTPFFSSYRGMTDVLTLHSGAPIYHVSSSPYLIGCGKMQPK